MTAADQAARLARLAPEPEIYHRPQPALYGCMYYAVYALTGDETLLEHAADVSMGAWISRIVARGASPHTIYATYFDTRIPASRQFWEQARSLAQQHRLRAVPLLATIPSTRVHGHHMVALHLPHRALDMVRISDSALPDVLELSWERFLLSPYAQAVEIVQLVPLGDYPFEQAAPVPLETP